METLLEIQQGAGVYRINWNAANVPAGLYFYKIQAGDFSEVKKCLLVK